MSSKFLYHDACPRCESKDNLGVFDDGHKWCFGCGYFEAGESSAKSVHEGTVKVENNGRAYPFDASAYIPAKATLWLLSCNIGCMQQCWYDIQWSESQQLVCWKIKNPQGKILGWQGRTFSPQAKTKYLSHGNIREDICLLGKGTDVVVMCEDFLSAIAIAESGWVAMPLFGCTCSLNVLQGVAKQFKQVVVWLDSDKLDNAREIALKASLLGMSTKVVYTQKDPKYYKREEIKEFLT